MRNGLDFESNLNSKQFCLILILFLQPQAFVCFSHQSGIPIVVFKNLTLKLTIPLVVNNIENVIIFRTCFWRFTVGIQILDIQKTWLEYWTGPVYKWQSKTGHFSPVFEWLWTRPTIWIPDRLTSGQPSTIWIPDRSGIQIPSVHHNQHFRLITDEKKLDNLHVEEIFSVTR